MSLDKSRSRWLRSNRAAGLVAAAVLLGIGSLMVRLPVVAGDEIVVYKSPTCGCCSAWIDHLEQSGFRVESHDRHDMVAIKNENDIPHQLRSCHTARVDGYIIEGHVPAREIGRLLRERPDVKGLAVGGMPMGSPGMEGPRSDPYDVTAFDADGNTSVYASY